MLSTSRVIFAIDLSQEFAEVTLVTPAYTGLSQQVVSAEGGYIENKMLIFLFLYHYFIHLINVIRQN